MVFDLQLNLISVFDIIGRYSAVFILATKKIVDIQAFHNWTSMARKAIFFSHECGRVARWCWVNKLPVPGRPADLDNSRAWACCACCRCGLFEHFFSCLSFLFSFSLPLGDGPI